MVKFTFNGIEGFWSYAKGRLLKFHGLSFKLFPLYLKELEFRYNTGKDNLYEERFLAQGWSKLRNYQRNLVLFV